MIQSEGMKCSRMNESSTDGKTDPDLVGQVCMLGVVGAGYGFVNLFRDEFSANVLFTWVNIAGGLVACIAGVIWVKACASPEGRAAPILALWIAPWGDALYTVVYLGLGGLYRLFEGFSVLDLLGSLFWLTLGMRCERGTAKVSAMLRAADLPP